jgi:hypothetical protein
VIGSGAHVFDAMSIRDDPVRRDSRRTQRAASHEGEPP